MKDIRQMSQLDSQLAHVSEKLSKDQGIRDKIVQDVVNAVKSQVDQNSKLRQEYESLIAKVEVQEVNMAMMQNMFDSIGFRPDKVLAELELQAMNISALKSEMGEVR